MKKYNNKLNLPAALILILAATILFTGCKYDSGSSSITTDSTRTQVTQKRPIDEVLKAHTSELMSIDGVNGVYQGQLDNGQDCITVMVVKKTPEIGKKIPPVLEGYPVTIEEGGVIHPMGK